MGINNMHLLVLKLSEAKYNKFLIKYGQGGIKMLATLQGSVIFKYWFL